MNPVRPIVIGFVVVAAAVGVWLGVRHGSSPKSAQADTLGPDASKFVGKWTISEGSMKTDWEFQAADAQKHEQSLAGKSMTVIEKDGVLWLGIDGQACREMLAEKSPDQVELVAGRTTCSEEAADGGKKAGASSNAKMTKFVIALDANGRAHVTGTSQFSLEADGKVHEGHLDFEGVAEKQAGTQP